MNKYIFQCIAMLFFLTSCEKEVDVDLRSVSPKLVIEGIVEEGNMPRVRLTTTKDFYEDNDFPPVTDALVEISDNKGNKEQLTLKEDGWYSGNEYQLIGTIGTTYTLTVTHDLTVYTATSTMPPRVEIDSIGFVKFPINDYPFPVLYFSDPLGEENQYYRNIIYVNGRRVKKDQETTSAEFVDGYQVKRIIPILMDQMDDDKEELEKGDTITVELHSIDRETYLFFETLGNNDNSLNNPTSNISGGALGYFGAYPVSWMSVIADWK